MKTTDTILDDIIAAKKDYLRIRKRQRSQAEVEHRLVDVSPFPGAGFFDALKASQPQPKIIAEAKKTSPSGGVLREPFSLSEINAAYQAAPNVVAISVITERDYFQGSEETLVYFAGHNAKNKPLLRKDFLFDPYQILESKLLGAQAYLLIASLFERTELKDLIELGRSLDLEPLVEVHTAAELELVKQTDARCIGVNSRDLQSFSVDNSAHRLLDELDDSYARVAESGINDPAYLEQISGFSDAVLIGGHFMRAPDISAAIEALIVSRNIS
jgi:indole-3-glycerol phosphate synthase